MHDNNALRKQVNTLKIICLFLLFIIGILLSVILYERGKTRKYQTLTDHALTRNLNNDLLITFTD